MPKLISKYLTGRIVSVRVGNTLSDSYHQQEGVQQGSILSVILFSMKINNNVKCLLNGINCSLYVDDFLIWYQSKNALYHGISSTGDKFIIYVHSLSCLQAIEYFVIENPLVLSILELHSTFKTPRKDVVFCWVPSHVGSRGNELADKAAKTDLKGRTTSHYHSVTCMHCSLH